MKKAWNLRFIPSLLNSLFCFIFDENKQFRAARSFDETFRQSVCILLSMHFCQKSVINGSRRFFKVQNRGVRKVHTKEFNLHFVSGSGQNFECEWNLVRDHAERQKWKWRWDSHFHLQKCEWNYNFHLHSAAPRRRALLQAITGQITYPRIQSNWGILRVE